MTNPSLAPRPFQPVGRSANRTLLEEMFSATPLGILIAAVKTLLRQRNQR